MEPLEKLRRQRPRVTFENRIRYIISEISFNQYTVCQLISTAFEQQKTNWFLQLLLTLKTTVTNCNFPGTISHRCTSKTGRCRQRNIF